MESKSSVAAARGTFSQASRTASQTVTAASTDDSDSSDSTEECCCNGNYRQQEELLSCRILGFYPFPTPPPEGPLGWLFRDTHQAIMVQSSSWKGRVLMDFMTKGGEFHPVWYNESVKWNVFLGGTIQGEVRVRFLGKKHDAAAEQSCGSTSPSKMERLLQIARSYNCDMNLYGNNCRMFSARMEREVERLNCENHSGGVKVEPEMKMIMDGRTTGTSIRIDATQGQSSSSEMAADFRCAMSVLGAGLLPMLYPLSALLFSYEGLRDL